MQNSAVLVKFHLFRLTLKQTTNNTIRRAEFMRILTSMYGLTERSDAYILWTDVRSDAWYAPCMGAGLLLPLYPGHYIYPEEPLTRLDAAYAILMTHDIEFD